MMYASELDASIWNFVKFWLEGIILAKNQIPSLYYKLGGKIKKIIFIPRRITE